MSGNFGAAPLTLEGRITDYPLDKPSGYPFKMIDIPGEMKSPGCWGRREPTNSPITAILHLLFTGEGYTIRLSFGR